MALLAGSAHALDTLALLDDGAAKALLQEKSPILAEATGVVAVPYAQALAVLDDPAFMQNVQEAYSALFAEGGEPEFEIRQAEANAYFYVNRKGERTDIVELLREEAECEEAFDIVLYSSGERFFGRYEALIHIRVTPSGSGASNYVASVHAYPENAVSRFFARHLGLVERYFRQKTGHMTEIVTSVALRLCGGTPDEDGYKG